MTAKSTAVPAAENTAAENTTKKTGSRRPWAPDKDDHFIYWCVKLEGRSQIWVANDMGVSQGTVSRIIQRYERWQAREEAQADGRLDHAERLRAQRWLTYERNESIVQSCLRIASKMEGYADMSRSTTQRPLTQPGSERELRSTSYTVDQHGIAARFLRLAYRVNMDQLKLAEQEELPPLPPLAGEQLALEEAAAAESTAALELARQECRNQLEERQQQDQEREAQVLEEDCQRRERFLEEKLRRERDADEQREVAEMLRAQGTGEGGQETGDREQETGKQASGGREPTEVAAGKVNHRDTEDTEAGAVLSAHNAHNDAGANTSATSNGQCSCDPKPRATKKPRARRMNPPQEDGGNTAAVHFKGNGRSGEQKERASARTAAAGVQ